MRIILQHTQTGLFYAGPDNWTSDDQAALTFERTDTAMDLVYERKLEDTRLLMRFDRPFLEIPLSIAGFGR
jgi:hypothetical protein